MKKNFFAFFCIVFIEILLCCKNIYAQVTLSYTKNVAPIIKEKCISCHRINGAAPFSLESFQDVYKRKETIALVTKSKYMPPWKADSHYVDYENDRSLSEGEILTIANWVKSGAIYGPKVHNEEKIMPDKSINKDVITFAAKTDFKIKGNGLETFVMFKIPYEMSSEKSINSIEFIPGNKELVHHANYAIQSVDEKIDIYKGNEYIISDQFQTNLNEFKPYMSDVAYYGGWVPGSSPQLFPQGIGFNMPKRGVILMTIHYAATSTDATDLSRINLYLSDVPITRNVQSVNIGSAGIGSIVPPLVIPADSVKKFKINIQTSTDLSVIYVWPHMHFLGSKFKAWATSPEGRYIPLVYIPEWDFNWQELYKFKKMLVIPKGSFITIEASYDNTANNISNPYSPPRTIISDGLMESKSEMLNLVMIFLPYMVGDEDREL